MTDILTTCAEAIFRVLTLKMASAQIVETSVTNNSPSQDSNHLDDLVQSRKDVASTIMLNDVTVTLKGI